jgi:hypothetical protein
MTAAATALPLSSNKIPENPKPRAVRAGVETISHVEGVIGLVDAGAHLGKVTTVVEKGISRSATKLAGAAAKKGWYKLAGWFLKIAASAPLAAKILVGIAVVAVAVTIYHVFRTA